MKTLSKPIRLSSKEVARADNDMTIVVRRQAKTGLYLVASVRVSTGRIALKPQIVTGELVSATVKEEVRFLDKMCMGGHMAHASRRRNRLKP